VRRVTEACADSVAAFSVQSPVLTTSRQLDRLCVVLVATRNPLNLGAAARAMSNFGCPTLRVVRPYEVSFRQARSAVGAEELLAKAEQFDSIADAVADCSLVVGTTAGKARTLQHALKPLEKAAPLIRRKFSSGPVALLFGSEKRGLSNQDMSHCHWLLRIPTRDAHASMNLGQAVAVCLYELVRLPKRAERALARKPPLAADLERLTELLAATLKASGYARGGGMSIEEDLRRMVLRLSLDETDSQLGLGMLRQILWKIRSTEKATKE
jgi:TrmH family RNA methyltransferase